MKASSFVFVFVFTCTYLKIDNCMSYFSNKMKVHECCKQALILLYLLTTTRNVSFKHLFYFLVCYHLLPLNEPSFVRHHKLS